jgi:hypothetical protein
MKMTRIIVLCGILMFMAGTVWGADGTITGITVTPANPTVGESFHVTVQGTAIAAGKKCQILFLKGDGTPTSQVGVVSSFPFTFGGNYPLYIYNTAGTYTIRVFSASSPYGSCTGEAQAVVKVRPKLQVGIAKNVATKANPCPPGWHKKSSEPSGAFICVPNMPSPKPQCPAGTQYFETECTVGCQVIIR